MKFVFHLSYYNFNKRFLRILSQDNDLEKTKKKKEKKKEVYVFKKISFLKSEERRM